MLWAEGFLEEATKEIKNMNYEAVKINLLNAMKYSVLAVFNAVSLPADENADVVELLRKFEEYFHEPFDKYIPVICDVIEGIKDTEVTEENVQEAMKKGYFVYTVCKKFVEGA